MDAIGRSCMVTVFNRRNYDTSTTLRRKELVAALPMTLSKFSTWLPMNVAHAVASLAQIKE
jgi:hypothetical protein